MALRHVILLAVLAIHLGVWTHASSLPMLPGNRLAEGPDRNLPGGIPITCGTRREVIGYSRTKRSITQATSSYFGSYAFTSGPIGIAPFPTVSGRFTYAEMRGDKYVYALQVDPTGESAYWLPQGGTIDIPRHPTAAQPQFVFTPDFSGCSWTVTPMSNGNLRLRHVTGEFEAAQFNNLTPAQKGGDITYALQYKDYGYLVELARLTGNIPASAYMRYTGGQWHLTYQQKTCASTTGGYVFQNQLLYSMVMVDAVQNTYNQVSGTRTYSIP